MTFSELISRYFVKIPLLQRDYVQGAHEKIARNFLSAIFENLAAKKSLQIDFIYGYLDGQFFVPIDGQQRLSTLFLLHLYFEKCQQNLQNFSYESRQSTKDFCEFLLANFEQIKRQKNEQKICLKEAIKNHEKYLYIFSFDPSAAAMIKMLELIDEFALKYENFGPNLDLIEFEFYKLENLQNGEELYIKMNARGRALSEYENFKSNTYQALLRAGFENLAGEFAEKIDGVWADFGYEIAKKIDEKFDAINSDNNEEILRKFWQFLGAEFDKFNASNTYKIEQKRVEFLFAAMNNLGEIFNNYEEIFTDKTDANKIKLEPEKNKNILKEFFSQKNDFEMSFKQRAMMFFYVDFCAQKSASKDDFIGFLRVVNDLFASTVTVDFQRVNSRLNEEQFYKICQQIYEAKNASNYARFCEQIKREELSIKGINRASLQMLAHKLKLLESLDDRQLRAFLELEQSEWFFCDASILIACKDFCALQKSWQNLREKLDAKRLIQRLIYCAPLQIKAHKYGSEYYGLRKNSLQLAPLFAQKYKQNDFVENKKFKLEKFKDFSAKFLRFFDENFWPDFTDFKDENFLREIVVRWPEFLDYKSSSNIFYNLENGERNFAKIYIYLLDRWDFKQSINPLINYIFGRLKTAQIASGREPISLDDGGENYIDCIEIKGGFFRLIDGAYEKLCGLKKPLDELNEEQLLEFLQKI